MYPDASEQHGTLRCKQVLLLLLLLLLLESAINVMHFVSRCVRACSAGGRNGWTRELRLNIGGNAPQNQRRRRRRRQQQQQQQQQQQWQRDQQHVKTQKYLFKRFCIARRLSVSRRSRSATRRRRSTCVSSTFCKVFPAPARP